MDVYKERQRDTDTKGMFQMESNGKVAPLHMYSKTINLITVKAKQPEPFGLHVTCALYNLEMEGRQARRKAD